MERAGYLLQEARNGLFTNLSSNDLLSVVGAVASWNSYDVRTAVLDYDYVTSYTTGSGGSVLLLRPSEVSQLVRRMFD
jgi:hypothetical protein